MQTQEKCYPEPGPELDSGSNDFRVSEMLNRVQHAMLMDFMTQKFQILLAGPLSKHARIPLSSAGGMNGLPSPLGDCAVTFFVTLNSFRGLVTY